MFELHQRYNKVVDEATSYLRGFFGTGGYALLKATEDGSLDKKRYDKERNLNYRYEKSVPYFMKDGNLHGCWGEDFIGPFGIFYPVSKKCHGLPKKLMKLNN